jgi:hypothetical protein
MTIQEMLMAFAGNANSGGNQFFQNFLQSQMGGLGFSPPNSALAFGFGNQGKPLGQAASFLDLYKSNDSYQRYRNFDQYKNTAAYKEIENYYTQRLKDDPKYRASMAESADEAIPDIVKRIAPTLIGGAMKIVGAKHFGGDVDTLKRAIGLSAAGGYVDSSGMAGNIGSRQFGSFVEDSAMGLGKLIRSQGLNIGDAAMEISRQARESGTFDVRRFERDLSGATEKTMSSLGEKIKVINKMHKKMEMFTGEMTRGEAYAASRFLIGDSDIAGNEGRLQEAITTMNAGARLSGMDPSEYWKTAMDFSQMMQRSGFGLDTANALSMRAMTQGTMSFTQASGTLATGRRFNARQTMAARMMQEGGFLRSREGKAALVAQYFNRQKGLNVENQTALYNALAAYRNGEMSIDDFENVIVETTGDTIDNTIRSVGVTEIERVGGTEVLDSPAYRKSRLESQRGWFKYNTALSQRIERNFGAGASDALFDFNQKLINDPKSRKALLGILRGKGEITAEQLSGAGLDIGARGQVAGLRDEYQAMAEMFGSGENLEANLSQLVNAHLTHTGNINVSMGALQRQHSSKRQDQARIAQKEIERINKMAEDDPDGAAAEMKKFLNSDLGKVAAELTAQDKTNTAANPDNATDNTTADPEGPLAIINKFSTVLTDLIAELDTFLPQQNKPQG